MGTEIETKPEQKAEERHPGRVVPQITTSESIAEMYAPKGDVEVIKEEPAAEAKKEEPKKPPMSRAQERITGLIEKQKTESDRADAERARADALEAEIRALKAAQTQATEIEDKPRPQRAAFPSDEEFEDAIGEWRAEKILAKREKEQRAAKEQAAERDLVETWQQRVTRAIDEIPDYADTIRKSEVILPGHIHRAILESEAGPALAYFFAKHPVEAKRYSDMSPTAALRGIGKLEDKLTAEEDEITLPAKKTAHVEVSKAPPPINPIRDAGGIAEQRPKDFESYRAKREAEKAARRH
jgi:hypothetical protein